MSINFFLEVCRQFSKNLPPLKALHNFLQHHVKSIMIIIYHGHMDETENTSRSERFLSYIPKHLFKVPINFRNASCSGWAQYIDLTVRTQLPFSFGTSDSFLPGLGRNRVYDACCSAKLAYKSVQQSRQQGLRAYLLTYQYILFGWGLAL